ncbi:DUF418 domain-containing protein [Bacillus paranthracis]|uniref:DUF418 domain-containing protein n=1 Tax=Bacillus TaxID=1386 RepID=UPI0002790627|nr:MULTISPECIES: DUF418 domain-containing protein [Bacillus]EJQ00418.1 hypothetical protein IC5_04382 [Bacillus cereus AND1407]KFL82646.1 hypothetical protein DJ51_4345 [Bacillus cereus]MRA62439.1 DUF418 domain-containing protein [Bacillus thuringiensis]OUB93800.1 hypothetical protein BK752_25095 [Bacillus thuringiensis serovar canadensis]KAB7635173.1 DUF418 domain-containing protein [Bacillus sp. B4-WWTP-NA-D-NA-NA]
MQKERIRIIDALRGFSLLGILLANVVIYSYGLLDTPNDQVKKIIMILTEGSFMPIFTFLFGYSLIKLVESLKRRNKHVRWHLTRRFAMLLLLGTLHATLWQGDVLLTYGIIGFLLLFIIEKKPRTLIIIGISLFLLSILTNSQTMPLFLFGMAAAKKNVFVCVEQEFVWYKRGLILIPIALIMKYIGIMHFENKLSLFVLNIGSLLLAIGYIAAFSLIFMYFSKMQIFKWFENVGKTSLTNYIMQTVIFVCGYHIGLFKNLDSISLIFVSLIIYAIQCFISSLYVKKYKYGPLENLLRKWTYWSWKITSKAS